MTLPPSPLNPAAQASEKMARLRQTYIVQLPKQLAHMHSLLDKVMHASAEMDTDPQVHASVAELHRLLHNLKGTGRSLGFAQLGSHAEQGETLLQERAPQWPLQLKKCLQQLQTTTQEQAQLLASSLAMSGPGFAVMDPLAQTPAHGRLVYVCDDDPIMLEQLAAQLACFGYEARGFTEPQALRMAFLQRRPDAVIMDIHFPQGARAGIDVLLGLRQETGAPVPAVFLSSRSDFDARLGAVRAGGQAYFVKPVRANALVEALDTLTHHDQPEPYRVLIVDDEPTVADYHALILQQAGMLTHTLHDPRQVLHTLSTFRPDLVLMDMYMPHCSGQEVAAVIRQDVQYVGLPMVYLTAETDRHKLLGAMKIGVEGALSKPVDPQELIGAVAVRAERMRTLRGLMARDSLTGLFNHTVTTQLLERALAQAQRTGAQLSFVMLDIDNFKAVNDTYGHPVGDQVLIALARVLQQRLRNSDIVGRYGGEEFAVILHNESAHSATRLIDALRQDFARVNFYSGEQEFHCTFSAGVASFPEFAHFEVLREAADQALYQAKRAGRNCVVQHGTAGPL
ncbi:MAG: diguanylate cyclase [Comamonas sp.]|nr:diguanylate cyclase [Comamonas sp.]